MQSQKVAEIDKISYSNLSKNNFEHRYMQSQKVVKIEKIENSSNSLFLACVAKFMVLYKKIKARKSNRQLLHENRQLLYEIRSDVSSLRTSRVDMDACLLTHLENIPRLLNYVQMTNVMLTNQIQLIHLLQQKLENQENLNKESSSSEE